MGSLGNETKGESKMTNELVKILEAAKEYKRRSMRWFGLYEESNCESDWQMCKELEMKCYGLLEAYEILTGKKVYSIGIDIDKEITVMLN